MRITAPLFAVLAALLCSCQTTNLGSSDTAHAADMAEARKVARDWLSLVDGERYDEAYERYTEAAKRRVKTKEQSIAFYRAVRLPHGSAVNRRVATERYATTLPMLAPGEYVVIDYVTDFQNKAGVKEEVLAERVGGKWEVSGYACGK